MSAKRIETVKKFFNSELDRLGLQERSIVEKFIKRSRASRDVNKEFDSELTVGQRVADKFAATMGSWTFIIIQSCILAAWVFLNVTAWINRWDPYPFILLNLALSFQAAYAAPIIMMSQNRQAEKDRLQTKYDYEIDTKAELEILQLHEKFDDLRNTHFAELISMQQRQIEMLENIIHELASGKSVPVDMPVTSGQGS